MKCSFQHTKRHDMPRILRLAGTTVSAIVAIMTVASGCHPDSGAPPAGTPARPKIALVMKSLANDFFSTMEAGARRHQAAHLVDYDLLVSGTKNETDLAQQVDLVEQAVTQGARAIVIAPADSKALIPGLRRAELAGVLIINIDNRLDADTARQAGLNAAFVGPDNRAGARRVGEVIAAKLSKGDEVAIIEGVTTAFNGQQRRAGFEEAMANAGIKVVTVQSGQWEIDRANVVAAGILVAHPNLKALLCANDNMAIGAAAAVDAAGKSHMILIAGFDNIGAIKSLLADGRVVATADQHADQLAVFGIEAALNALKSAKPAQDQVTAVNLVTAADLVTR